MSFSQCGLCLEYQSFLVSASGQGKVHGIMINKMFESIINKLSDELTFICLECDRNLKDCHVFYEKINKVHSELSSKITNDNSFPELIVKDENCVNSFQNDDPSVLASMPSEDSSPFDNGSQEIIKTEDSFEEDILKDHYDNLYFPEPHSDNTDSLRYVCDSNLRLKNKKIKIKKCKDSKKSLEFVKKSLHKTKVDRKLLKIQKNKEDIVKLNENDIIVIDVNEKKLSCLTKSVNSSIVKENISNTSESIPAQISLNFNSFPKQIVKDGKLIITGHELTRLIDKFYDLHCQNCPSPFKTSTVAQLFRHYEIKHNIKGHLKCCDTKLNTRRGIYWHMARHLQPSDFECPICKFSVWKPSSLVKHMQTRHLPQSERRRFDCDQCDRTFWVPDALKNHKIEHIPPEERHVYVCEFCAQSFDMPRSYKRHIKVMHLSDELLCPICGKKFHEKANFAYHIGTHETDESKKVKCNECGILLANKHILRKHLPVHSTPKYFCNQCNFATHQSTYLKTHMQVKHSDIKPHICSVCNKRFKLKSLLKFHMAQHTGERKMCEFCPKTFTSSWNYHTHRKRMHPNEVKDIPPKKRGRNNNI